MKPDTLLKILAWERAYKQAPDPWTIVELFQELIDSGDIQHMDERYHQTANILLAHGFCTRPKLRIVK